MRFSDVLAAVAHLDGKEKRGTVTVNLIDLVQWVSDLEQAIVLLRGARGHGPDWTQAKNDLLAKYHETIVH